MQPASLPSSNALFSKVLIANRGEIACRVIATCRRLGIATVAVYSDADANARHVRLADEAVHIGPAAAAESYLRGEVILDAARRTGAQAIHPGYGFLSENAGFARACSEAGIRFIGPPVAAIEAMGSKSAAKALMSGAGVPLTPGYHGDDQDAAFLQQQADAIGYPVLIKASAGGGGKGMRRVDRADDFADALASCRREATNAFGDDRVLVEKYVLSPRHIEIQVFADTHGNVVHLFERDCSVQRRHQKVLEEAPAPGMTPERRAAMGAAAVEAARAVGYVGAGTVEFIASPDGSFFFMEMNTRLQVEHPVTEMITGTDLVEWQLRVAAGQLLPMTQDQLTIDGHAIEARLYAEDADRGFLPSTGTLHHLQLPPCGDGVRVDAGVETGDTISPWYDPMMAKLIVHGSDREQALRKLDRALSQVQALGITTNAAFLRRLIATGSFADACLDTALIDREQVALTATPPAPSPALWSLAAVLVSQPATPDRHRASPATGWTDPWSATDGWRLHGRARIRVPLRWNDQQASVDVAAGDGNWICHVDEVSVHLRGAATSDGRFHMDIDGHRVQGSLIRDGARHHVFIAGQHWTFETVIPGSGQHSPHSLTADSLQAPMPGRVVSLLVEAGSAVAAGQAVMVMEAMKMEHTLTAPTAGLLQAFLAQPGDIVSQGQLLAELERHSVP